MHLNRLSPAKHRQKGMGLVMAIFMIVIVSSAIAFVVRMSAVQAHSVTVAILGAKAYQAARSGLEWGSYRAVRDNSCVASSSWTFTSGQLNGFTVVVECVQRSYTEGFDAIQMYELMATSSYGTYGTSTDFVSRRLVMTLSD